jgi:hypothetical protein
MLITLSLVYILIGVVTLHSGGDGDGLNSVEEQRKNKGVAARFDAGWSTRLAPGVQIHAAVESA